jgi:membrane protein YqaA with SNARE-associated domain
MLSSIIPIPTEVTLSALLIAGFDKTVLLTVLLTSSIVGGFVSYYLGYTGNRLFKRFYKLPRKQHEERLNVIMARYGWIIIFISPWIPVYSDIVPMISGIKKYDLRKFTVAMVSGRIVKVIAVVYFLAWFLPLVFR